MMYQKRDTRRVFDWCELELADEPNDGSLPSGRRTRMGKISGVLQVDSRLNLLPVVHGSADSASQVRQWLLAHPPKCLAVPLPPSFFAPVMEGILELPNPSIVMQPETRNFAAEVERDWEPDQDQEENERAEARHGYSYVPIDPCQPVIAGLRLAMEEHWRIEFIDEECADYVPFTATLPDPYALKHLSLEKFATACLPWLTPPSSPDVFRRLKHQAQRLSELQKKYSQVTMLTSIQEWPWLRDRVSAKLNLHSSTQEDELEANEADDSADELPDRYAVDPRTLIFLFGELPFITAYYEHKRKQLEDDAQLTIDGVKHLLLSARSSYMQDFGKRARRITPLLLSQCLKYIRNMTLLQNRLTPDLYTMVVACQQTMGDQFAIHLVSTAREYGFCDDISPLPIVKLGIEQARMPAGDVVDIVSRLPGPPVVWRSLELRKTPEKTDQHKWASQWNPYQQCSWPPEDEHIESFRTRVFERAKSIMGADLARTEKFSTSILDGIDIRETLRHWYDGDIYVKVLPPSVGMLDACVMLFENNIDPRMYPWRTTWYAEHKDESTLAFFATDFGQELVGPGIAMASYGGAMFLYPPVAIPDIWHNRELDFTDTLEDRLIAAACKYGRGRHVALLSPTAPGANLRRLAKRFGKKLVHVPLAQFNDAMIQQLRMVHVLNGKEVRSYAADFIRKA
jgi:hypothetical protein